MRCSAGPSDERTHADTRAGWSRRFAVLGAAVVLATVAACSSPPYEGPGTDHPFVGRSIDEIQPCDDPMCGVGGINNGTLDGEVVRITGDLVREEGSKFVSDLACTNERTNLVVDGDTIVAAVEQSC